MQSAHQAVTFFAFWKQGLQPATVQPEGQRQAPRSAHVKLLPPKQNLQDVSLTLNQVCSCLSATEWSLIHLLLQQCLAYQSLRFHPFIEQLSQHAAKCVQPQRAAAKRARMQQASQSRNGCLICSCGVAPQHREQPFLRDDLLRQA